jgi:hypothetical protein
MIFTLTCPVHALGQLLSRFSYIRLFDEVMLGGNLMNAERALDEVCPLLHVGR